ncbi:single-stranded DNA-binding protein [Bacillus pseudomycoides]|uniref:single-stranded DNA-binding protein n=1 Tax=Bacillus pseudomycoides TaxID=64104 RepID=UPI000BF04422|nr:single-stranded DNA-binding protein [Bacillus pseudomycoides]PEK34100.1 single-stranded DNA-binding protein [Bacillus pseudomycoides]
MNNFNGIGRLTKDVDLTYTPNGLAVAKFTLAIKRNYKNGQGEFESDFINFVAWKGTAEAIANYTQKGMQLGVSGRLQSRNYDDDNGKKHFVVEVVVDNVTFLEKKKQPQPQ